VSSLKSLRDELLADPAVREEYDRKKTAHEIASQLVGLRARLGITQAEMAKIAGMTQPEIARLESGEVSARLDTLGRVLDAVGAKLEIRPPKARGHKIAVRRKAAA
jgi:transcriptional regulator with XRE-family HTH domain